MERMRIRESVDTQPFNKDIGTEIERLRANIASMKVRPFTKLEREEMRNKEDRERFVRNTKIMITGISALIAIPAIAKMFPPNAVQQVTDVAMHFALDEHFAETMGVLGAIVAAIGIHDNWDDMKKALTKWKMP